MLNPKLVITVLALVLIGLIAFLIFDKCQNSSNGSFTSIIVKKDVVIEKTIEISEQQQVDAIQEKTTEISTRSFRNTINLQNGDMIKTEMHPDVYTVMYTGNNSYKRLMLNPSILESYTTFDQVNVVQQSVLDAHATISFVMEVDGNGNPTTGLIYFYTSLPNSDVGQKHLVVLTDQEWQGLGLNKDSVFAINTFEANSEHYSEGENITIHNFHQLTN